MERPADKTIMVGSAKRLSQIWLFLGLGLWLIPGAAIASLPLAPSLVQELNLVLKASDGLHRSLVSQDEEMIEFGLRDVLLQLERVRVALPLAKPHERSHLARIVQAAREQFEMTQTSYGEERRTRLEEAFNQLVNLARIYRLDRNYSIFFCPKDRTTWIQKGYRAQNPFRPDSASSSCGIRVSR